MNDALIAFIQKWLGVAGAGDTAGNKGQCVGLVELWIDQNKHPHIAGNAVDLLANANLDAYRMFRNSPVNYPPPGAIVCWDGSWGAGYGHTAVVIAANVLQLVVAEQNDPEGAAPLVATHSYAGVAGWLTFK